ncbi:hypothetical protein [Selenihalanaerobacter shriftii]|uniref:Uncharacterized protein n=1 Tax=Selenihalanaerobacter shriftii TaxID=142842 RepID=A0A1T4MY37_9FIRM|nr:hypothetical protein [Selenihalanaerobacter shriftii]SJZ71903.1 hypothetical protein SAMN02745118_01641 [Selenihalanaerobacter shriftii]
MLKSSYMENKNGWLGLMQIKRINFLLPEIVKEINELFLELNLDVVIAGGIISDSYLLDQEIISEIKSSDIDIFINIKVDSDKIIKKLNSRENISDLTPVQEEKITATYSKELVSKRVTFNYNGYDCDLLFCTNPQTKVWDFDLTFRQFMYFKDELYATQLAINDIKDKLLRVLNPVNNIITLKRLTKFKRKYNFKFEMKSYNLLLNYIMWLDKKQGLEIKDYKIGNYNERKRRQLFTGQLKEYYYRLISQKKAHGRALITYLLINNNYYNDYFNNLLGTYHIEYDTNLNYSRFINKVKDLHFKIKTEFQDKKEVIESKNRPKDIVDIDWEDWKRIFSMLEQVSELEFREFLKGWLNDNKVDNCYRWHSPKIGKLLVNLKGFIDDLGLNYYKNYAINLCDQLLELFNTRGPDNFEFKITISQEPIDLLSISTDQNWTSCLELPDPDSQRTSAARIAANLQPNTLVAYITDLKGEEWLGRVIIRLLRNGNLTLEKYYGEPILKEVLFNKLEKIILDSDYQLSKGEAGQSCVFVEWEPYSDQGRVQSLNNNLYREYYIDYSLPTVIKSRFEK